MKTVNVRGIVIGEGVPKICIPVAERTPADITYSAGKASLLNADIIELRADWLREIADPAVLKDVLEGVRDAVSESPLLFTFRTSGEGGEAEISEEEYKDINIRAIESGLIDMVDAEISHDEAVISDIITAAHMAGVKVVASHHDFAGTPEREVMVDLMRRMQETGADIVKVAVMPRSRRDVLTLLAASEEMSSEYAECPVITISMSGEGVISRLACELSGSAVTFGAASRRSAPGQIDAGELRSILEMLHSELNPAYN